MLCFLCGKKIGLLRALADRQYCCAQHRREARLADANALREEDDQELWSVTTSRRKQKHPAKPSTSAPGPASIFALLVVAGLIVVALMPSSGGGGGGHIQISLDPTVQRGLFERAGDAIGGIVRASAPVTLHHDFTSGLADWTTVAMRGAGKVDDPKGWLTSANADIVKAGSFRIWNRSTTLQNYQMEFVGQIEKKSLSWAFRATGDRDYYATKLLITKPGPLPNAGLLHYVMLNGQESDRVLLPIPVTLERGTSYRVRVSVQDDRFITYLNGQIVSSWSDRRLHRGGVGFFADEEDPAEIKWVSLSERDSFLGRMLAHFSLIVMPGAAYPPIE